MQNITDAEVLCVVTQTLRLKLMQNITDAEVLSVVTHIFLVTAALGFSG
jgi:hypothetical protein